MVKKVQIKTQLPKNPVKDTFTLALSGMPAPKEDPKKVEAKEEEKDEEEESNGETITGLVD